MVTSLMHLHSIEALGIAWYRIVVASDDGIMLESPCEIIQVPQHQGDAVSVITCSSDTFNKASSMGFIDSRKIASALFAFELSGRP
jgi:hypothetical protein